MTQAACKTNDPCSEDCFCAPAMHACDASGVCAPTFQAPPALITTHRSYKAAVAAADSGKVLCRHECNVSSLLNNISLTASRLWPLIASAVYFCRIRHMMSYFTATQSLSASGARRGKAPAAVVVGWLCVPSCLCRTMAVWIDERLRNDERNDITGGTTCCVAGLLSLREPRSSSSDIWAT